MLILRSRIDLCNIYVITTYFVWMCNAINHSWSYLQQLFQNQALWAAGLGTEMYFTTVLSVTSILQKDISATILSASIIAVTLRYKHWLYGDRLLSYQCNSPQHKTALANYLLCSASGRAQKRPELLAARAVSHTEIQAAGLFRSYQAAFAQITSNKTQTFQRRA